MNAVGESQGGITLEKLFRALEDPIRRQTLMVLEDESTIEREELGSMLAEGAVGDTEAVRTRLYHHHLPHLDEVDLIDWDRQEGRVEPGSNYEEARLHIDGVQDLQ